METPEGAHGDERERGESLTLTLPHTLTHGVERERGESLAACRHHVHAGVGAGVGPSKGVGVRRRECVAAMAGVDGLRGGE